MTALLLALLVSNTPASFLETNEDVSFRVGKQLRCPVCQGMPIAESPSDMAQAMMKRIRELSNEGKSEREIKDYFVERYGEWVLLAPEQKGFNWVVWVLPPVGLIFALLLVVRAARNKKVSATKPSITPELNNEDPYLAAVRRAVDE